MWNGNYSNQSSIRFACYKNSVIYNLIYPNWLYTDSGEKIDDTKAFGEWPRANEDPWNQYCNFGSDIWGQDLFFTVTFEPAGGSGDGNLPRQTVYLNGKEIKNGFLGKQYFEEFIKQSGELNYLEIGRCTWNGNGYWYYQKGLCYTTRIYNKALTEDEVKANFETTKTYHDYITEVNKK